MTERIHIRKVSGPISAGMFLVALSVTALVAPATSAAGPAVAEPGEEIDPRVRSLVRPTRIVWESASTNGFGVRAKVLNSGSLLKEGFGQVPEGGWGVPSVGCQLVNDGEAPGVLLDFGREIHGGLRLGVGSGPRAMRLRVRFGESVAEAMCDIGEKGATNDHAIRDEEIVVPSFGTTEIGNTGFRFVRLDLVTTGRVTLEFVRAVSLMRPMARLGAFRCSDERLNRIWETAVRTVHLCCQEYLWDGIKRDRLVWMGDTHPETMSILSVFGSQDDVLPRSLDYMVAVTPTTAWMNTMGTYTLWWVRNVAEWYRYTGDRAYIGKHRQYIAATMDKLIGCVTPTNTFAGIRRPFLDWPTEHNRPAVDAGVQGLAVITFREGAFLADELGEAGLAARCRAAAERVASQPRLGPCGSKQAAAMLALSGLREPREMYDEVLGRDGHAGVSTFYGYYMLEAMSAAGENRRALDTVRDYWGAMLDVGATSFWEDFSLAWTNGCFRIDELPVAGRKDVHGDYGEFCYRGFRHSLCHGWSSGPAAWLIRHVLGIRPDGVGCKSVEVKPFLGDLAWAEGAMALPGGGSVRVRADRDASGRIRARVDAPAGVEVRNLCR